MKYEKRKKERIKERKIKRLVIELRKEKETMGRK